MYRLPSISGKKLIRCLEKIGYRVVRQRGSHIRLHPDVISRQPITVPNHKVLGRGLLRKIIRDANLSVDDFLKLF